VSQSASGQGHSPIAELVGLVEGVRLLEEHIDKCVTACCEEGYGATEAGAPGTVELFAGCWLCRPWCDCLGREAMKLHKG
jgi:hypothetical protein